MILQSCKIGRVLLFFLIITNVSAQSLPDSTTKRIDSLFMNGNTTNSPGGAIGIVRNDSLIYAKGYGMANLEYGISITPETIFDMGSVSKQFTAYCIVLLAKQGKIQLDDDIHKYLSWFPDLKEKITIRNLLHHTSGIREYTGLLSIVGTRKDDVITSEMCIKLLGKQERLSFKPGEKFSYSNSNFLLLAEIIKLVTGVSLRQFADSAIFQPLNMVNTQFIDNYKEIIKNRSYSYERTDSAHFENSISSYASPGASSLFCNIDDMAKWVMNFYNPKAGDQNDIEQLVQKGKLNNGNEISYASGIGVDTYKGWKLYAHDGAIAGYRTILIIIPDLKMGFIVFSNDGDFRWGVYGIMDLLINDTTKTKTSGDIQKRDSSKAIFTNIASMQKITGNYISEDGIQVNFRLSNNKLYADASGQSSLLWKDKADTFSYFNDPAVKFKFTSTARDSSVLGFSPDEDPRLFKKYINPLMQTDGFLRSYTGIYYCSELDTKYTIILKDHHLVLTNNNTKDAELALAGKNDLISNSEAMPHLSIMWNSKNQVTGFEMNAIRIMHLRFNKIE